MWYVAVPHLLSPQPDMYHQILMASAPCALLAFPVAQSPSLCAQKLVTPGFLGPSHNSQPHVTCDLPLCWLLRSGFPPHFQ